MYTKSDSLRLIRRPSFAIIFTAFIIFFYIYVLCYEQYIEPLRLARAKFMDYYFKARLFYNERYRSDFPKESAVVLIAIDDDSVLRTRQNIHAHAELTGKAIENISASGPKVIVLDIVFLSNPFVKTPPIGRDKLVEAIKKAGNVLAGYQLGDMGLLQMDAEVLEACMDYGRVDSIASSGDDVVRTLTPPGFEQEQQIEKIPLPIKAALLYRDIPSYMFTLNKAKRKIYFSSKHDLLTVPLTLYNQIPINYLYSEDRIPTIPVWKFLQEDFRSELLQGKIALLSDTSKVSYDRHYTPIGKMPGGLILANLINSFVHSYLLVEATLWTQSLILLLVGSFLAFLFYKNKLVPATLALLLTMSISPVVSFILLLHNIVWNAFDIIALALILYVTVLIHKASIWELENKSLKAMSE